MNLKKALYFNSLRHSRFLKNIGNVREFVAKKVIYNVGMMWYNRENYKKGELICTPKF